MKLIVLLSVFIANCEGVTIPEQFQYITLLIKEFSIKHPITIMTTKSLVFTNSFQKHLHEGGIFSSAYKQMDNFVLKKNSNVTLEMIAFFKSLNHLERELSLAKNYQFISKVHKAILVIDEAASAIEDFNSSKIKINKQFYILDLKSKDVFEAYETNNRKVTGTFIKRGKRGNAVDSFKSEIYNTR